jgi:hypothetical protein
MESHVLRIIVPVTAAVLFGGYAGYVRDSSGHLIVFALLTGALSLLLDHRRPGHRGGEPGEARSSPERSSALASVFAFFAVVLAVFAVERCGYLLGALLR